jgi:hypothetical protein
MPLYSLMFLMMMMMVVVVIIIIIIISSSSSSSSSIVIITIIIVSKVAVQTVSVLLCGICTCIVHIKWIPILARHWDLGNRKCLQQTYIFFIFVYVKLWNI